MKKILILSAMVALSACSTGQNRFNTGSTSGSNGAISRACLSADRSAASTPLCGCVQRVANAELNSTDRGRVARFFADPEFAHAIRISDTTANDAFWRRYQDFVAKARSQCG